MCATQAPAPFLTLNKPAKSILSSFTENNLTLLILFGIPVAQLLIFGTVIKSEIKDVKIAIYDQSKDETTQRIINKLLSSGYFVLENYLNSTNDIEDIFRKGKIKEVIVFEPDFGKSLVKEGKADMQIIADASDPNVARLVAAYTRGIVNDFVRKEYPELKMPNEIVTDVRMYFNENLKSVYMFVPGIRNTTRLKGEVNADTIIGRSYPLFHFGMADWSVIAIEQINGQADARLNLTLGSVIAGGEMTVSLNYDSKDPFTEKQQYYLWRYVNNDNSTLRQVMAGKIATHATSSIYNPVVGVQITNTPTTFRRSFGSYTLSDKTEPGWIVELYVNNVLVDYVKADASGFFTFEVPLVYGNSMVRLKYYGPWGEERTHDQNITIPFNFIPKNTLEYTASAGMVEDTLLSRFSRTSINYGLTRGLTIGGGFEYLSSVFSNPLMPYINASFRLASNLLLSGEYTHKVRTKGALTYRLPSNLLIDLNYTKYDKNQKAINYNYLEERKAVVSMPIHLSKFSAYNRLTVNQLVLPSTKYTTGEWLLSGSLLGVNTNFTTSAIYIGKSSPYVYSNISLSFRFPSGFTIIPQAQYSYTDKKLLSIKLGLEKRLMQFGFLNLSYEQNFRSNLHMVEFGFRYDFKFAQTGFSARQTDNSTTLIQFARGSLINDHSTDYLGIDNRTNVGKGGITIISYLDLNANGKRDTGEPKASGLKLHASSGRIERSEQDTTIRILGLEPYTDCYIEFDQSSFDNIAWRMQSQTLNVAVDPNMLKLIEIPVIIVGEASGMVKINRNGFEYGLARLIINFYTKDQKPVGRTLTEEDGYFSFLGLVPGAYIVRLDAVQLRRLSMISSPDSINFNVTTNMEGDFVDGLDFKVKMKTIEPVIAPE